MKKALIVALLGVNAALLAALVLGTGTETATAQVFPSGTDYIAVTGKMAQSWDALYVIDQGRRRLRGFAIDKQQKKLTPFGNVRDLPRDFGQRTEGR
jgi:hypothetical protein